VTDWAEIAERERRRYEDGEARVGGLDDRDDRQRQLTRMANAAGGAALALLMAGRRTDAQAWFERAAERYRESFDDAPPGSWGRPIGAIKSRVLGDDWAGAEAAALWTIELGAAEAESPIGRYAGCLALLVLGDHIRAGAVANSLHGRPDFPEPVADALRLIAAGDDLPGYALAVEAVLDSFETREEYLEDVPAADTVLVLQALAARRGLEHELESPLLPPA
jgi:hypothetical protein